MWPGLICLFAVHIVFYIYLLKSGRVLVLRPRGPGFEPHWRNCVVVLEQDTFILA